jgi:hypothetical protein
VRQSQARHVRRAKVVMAEDNTIVNSGTVGFSAQAFTGFCLRAKEA